MILKLKRTPGLYLVGFMGSGKTTVGRSLAWELGWSFIDIDQDIETREGESIFSIFEKRGEAEFRRLETEMLQYTVRAVERGKPSVVALGGGAFAHPANVELLKNNGVTIWLDCPLDLVRTRVERESHRPLARDPEKLRMLYDARRPAYAQADFRIEVTGNDPAAVVAGILRLPLF